MSRVIVITGGSDGIGAEMARQLAARHGAGIKLVLAALPYLKASRGAIVAVSSQGKAGRWLKLIAPGVVDRMALAAVKDDLRLQ